MSRPLADYWACQRGAYDHTPRWGHDDLIIALCALVDARWIVELGSGDGNATAKFIEYVQQHPDKGRVWSVDKGATVAKANLSHHQEATFVIADTVEFAGRAWRDGAIDVLYCDSDHSRQHVLNELNAWVPRFKPKLVLIDDTLDPNAGFGSPYEAALDFVAANPGWRVWNIPIHTGLTILVPPSSPRGGAHG